LPGVRRRAKPIPVPVVLRVLELTPMRPDLQTEGLNSTLTIGASSALSCLFVAKETSGFFPGQRSLTTRNPITSLRLLKLEQFRYEERSGVGSIMNHGVPLMARTLHPCLSTACRHPARLGSSRAPTVLHPLESVPGQIVQAEVLNRLRRHESVRCSIVEISVQAHGRSFVHSSRKRFLNPSAWRIRIRARI
jgi:hypothetical protein